MEEGRLLAGGLVFKELVRSAVFVYVTVVHYNRKSHGTRFREALKKEWPLQIVGVIHAYAAIMAGHAGFRALYLSGAGVANASHGLPDLGMTTLDDVLEDVRRIMGATDVPLLVDGDTGWGSPSMVARGVRELTKAGAAALHIEDQIDIKRCGHRPSKFPRASARGFYQHDLNASEQPFSAHEIEYTMRAPQRPFDLQSFSQQQCPHFITSGIFHPRAAARGIQMSFS